MPKYSKSSMPTYAERLREVHLLEIEWALHREAQLSARAVGLVVLATIALTAVGTLQPNVPSRLHTAAPYLVLIVLYAAAALSGTLVIVGRKLSTPRTPSEDSINALSNKDEVHRIRVLDMVTSMNLWECVALNRSGLQLMEILARVNICLATLFVAFALTVSFVNLVLGW